MKFVRMFLIEVKYSCSCYCLLLTSFISPTATHGTGLTVGNLAALVTKIKFVSGTGKVCAFNNYDSA